jgi:hypothetical protein
MSVVNLATVTLPKTLGLRQASPQGCTITNATSFWDNFANRTFIYGDDKIFGGLSNYHSLRRDKQTLNIAWGVGTMQSFPILWRYMKARRPVNLIGSRDFGDTRYSYAPYPSSMAPTFDAPTDPIHDVKFCAHGRKTAKIGIKITNHIPVLTNNCNDLNTALNFVSSGATVISNTYHGVYWGLLMGRKKLCLLFSNKIGKYHLLPRDATATNWQGEISNPIALPNMRDIVRAVTTDFKALADARIATHV